MNARRLRAGDSQPDVGWLICGIFTQVDEGNQLHRATSGKAPGAVITLNPYVAIAKFALSSRDLEQNVKQAAAKIAADGASRVSSVGGPSR